MPTQRPKKRAKPKVPRLATARLAADVRRQTRLLKAILESMAEGVIVADNEGKFLVYNKAAQRLSGVGWIEAPLERRAEAFGIFRPDAVTPLPNQELPLARAIRGESTDDVELFVRNSKVPSGMFLSATGRPVKDEAGRSQGGLVVFRDVTASRRVEAALHELRERLHTIVAGAPIVLFAVDAQGVFTLSEGKGLEALGLRPGEVVGRSAFEVYRDVPEVGKNIRRALAGESFTAEVRVGELYFNAHYEPLVGSAARIEGVIGVALDVTEHYRAEALLHQQAAAMKASMDGVAVLGADENFIFLNEAHAKLYGYDRPEDLIGGSWRVLYGAKELERFEGGIMPAFRKTGQWRGEAVGRRRDGTEWPQEVSLSSIEGGGAVCVVRDITERRRVDSERDRLYELEKLARSEAESASRSKDEFLAMISHELRTPMTAMLGWTWLLRGGTLDQENFARAIDIIERNMKLQAQVIEDLLDVSSIVTGKMRLDARVVELGPILQAAVDVARPAAEAKGIRIEPVSAPKRMLVLGDPDRLQQVFWNLVSNAVKFTPKGGVVTAALRGADSSAEIVVADDGQGIAPDFLPFVFDPFRQGESTITRSMRGLGLGLAIVRHLVEHHGGTVRAHSPGPGKGSVFTVRLPVAGVDAEGREPAPQPAPAAPRPRFGAAPTLGGVKVLVVDDEPDTREMVAAVLEQYGAEVRTAEGAPEALARLQEWRPDVLISDIAMPGEDGYELIRKVRALGAERGGDTRAAALTACARVEDRTMALLAGYQIYLPKPVEPAELAAVVGNLAGRNPQ